MTDVPRVGAQRPGGRAARVRADVLGATIEVLDEVGYDQLGVEEVARRAGVHKTTVYRRWPTKPELVADAVRVTAEVEIPVPDTGALTGDLRALARAVAATISGGGGARRARSIVAAAASADGLDEALGRFWAARMALATPIIERAIERGEVPSDCDPITVIETTVGALWLRALLTGEPLDDAFVVAVADLVSAGATGEASS